MKNKINERSEVEGRKKHKYKEEKETDHIQESSKAFDPELLMNCLTGITKMFEETKRTPEWIKKLHYGFRTDFDCTKENNNKRGPIIIKNTHFKDYENNCQLIRRTK